MAGKYKFLACDLITGRIRESIELTQVSAQRTLSQVNPGVFSANMPLGGLDPVIAQDRIDATDTARSTIVVVRDNVALGEWVVWDRPQRANDGKPIQLHGSYITCYLDQVIPNFSAATGDLPAAGWPTATDQITIAQTIAKQVQDPITSSTAPVGSRGIALTIPTIALSGITVTQTDWPGKYQTVAQMLNTMSGLENGFDWDIDVTLNGNYVQRTLNLSYPRRGINSGVVLQPSASRPGGNATTLSIDESGSRIKTQIIGIGSGAGSSQIIDNEPARTDTLDSSQAALVASYPLLQSTFNDASITVPATLKRRTRARGMASRTATVPPTITVLADSDPVLGSYQCGDYMTVVAGTSTNYPTGFNRLLRLASFTITPPAAGPETVELALADIVEVY